MKIFFLIPVRKGSKGIPQKNTNILGTKPLISHVTDKLIDEFQGSSVIISTDDELVKSMYSNHCIIHNRSENDADDDSTLDEVAVSVVNDLNLNPEDILITCQATSPLLKISTVLKGIDILKSDPLCDTVISAVLDKHLRWVELNGKYTPAYQKRVNRQMLPNEFRETGGLIGSRVKTIIEQKSRIGQNIKLLRLSEEEGIDIDNHSDWALSEYHLGKKNICIRVDGAPQLGFGHIYRSIALYNNLLPNEVTFLSKSHNEYQIGFDYLRSLNLKVLSISSDLEVIEIVEKSKCDILINDILDTKESYIENLKRLGIFVVNFEDLGIGGGKADLVINELYPSPSILDRKYLTGLKYALLNPVFERVKAKSKISPNVDRIIITFGGTDPSNLTIKAIKSLENINFNGNVDVVVGPGNQRITEISDIISISKLRIVKHFKVLNMAELIAKADVAITSAGRTVTELIAMNVPGIVLCQNLKELEHTHASIQYGVVNVGIGENLTIEVLGKHIRTLIENFDLRESLKSKMNILAKDRSNKRIINIILKKYEEEKNTNTRPV